MVDQIIPKSGAPEFWAFAAQVAESAPDKPRARERFKLDWRAANPDATEQQVADAMAELDRLFGS